MGPSFAPVAAMVAGNVALAFGPVFVRMADTGPVATGFWRLALAAPVLLLLGRMTGQRMTGLRRPLLVVILLGGAAFAADLASWHIGILRTTLANATLFGNAAVIFFPIYGFLIARAWPTRMQGLALLLAGVGAILLMGRSYTLSHEHLVGDLLCLLAGMLYTLYFITMARAREVLPALPALALCTLASALPLLIAANAMGERVVPYDWWPVIGVALMSQVFGQGLMIYAIGRLSPLVMGIGLLVQPIVAATAGWLLYGEMLGTADWIGAVLVAAALVLVRDSEAGGEALAPVPVQGDIEP